MPVAPQVDPAMAHQFVCKLDNNDRTTINLKKFILIAAYFKTNFPCLIPLVVLDRVEDVMRVLARIWNKKCEKKFQNC